MTEIVTDFERIRMVGSAYRKTGRPVALVPLGLGVHAGHIALVHAAARRRGAVVVAAVEEGVDAAALEGVDYLWFYRDLWPKGQRTQVVPLDHGLEPVADLAPELTRILALIGALGPSEVFVGEKDYELLVALGQAINDLHLGVRVRGVPVVRMPDGVPVSLRNAEVPVQAREQAGALSAALTAGAYAAEDGAQAVLSVARQVLAAAGVEPEYLALRGRDLGPAPEVGDARLLVAATIGGVRLIDNVGVPIGIGFRNIDNG